MLDLVELFTFLIESNKNFILTSLRYTKVVDHRMNLRYLLGAILFLIWFLVPD